MNKNLVSPELMKNEENSNSKLISKEKPTSFL